MTAVGKRLLPGILWPVHKDVLDDIIAVSVDRVGHNVFEHSLNDLIPNALVGVHQQALHNPAAVHILAHGYDLSLQLDGLPLGAAGRRRGLTLEQCLYTKSSSDVAFDQLWIE